MTRVDGESVAARAGMRVILGQEARVDGESVALRAEMRVILGQETRVNGDDVAVRVGRAEMDMQIKSKALCACHQEKK